jgi:hypothetical protein
MMGPGMDQRSVLAQALQKELPLQGGPNHGMNPMMGMPRGGSAMGRGYGGMGPRGMMGGPMGMGPRGGMRLPGILDGSWIPLECDVCYSLEIFLQNIVISKYFCFNLFVRRFSRQ